jgi:hypothetical protein
MFLDEPPKNYTVDWLMAGANVPYIEFVILLKQGVVCLLGLVKQQPYS